MRAPILLALLSIGACRPAPAIQAEEPALASASPAAPSAPPSAGAMLRPSPREPAVEASAPPPSPRRSASSEARSRDGRLVLRGVDGHARHTHGGEPARLGGMHLEADNQGDPREIVVERVEFLRGASCEAPAEVATSLVPVTLDTLDHVSIGPGLRVKLPARRKIPIDVHFAPQQAYQSWCNRFAFRLHVRSGDEVLHVVAETHVTRVTPLRPEP